ncbi:unnamed protein product [Polarella glacialis]|uniref:Calmodulin-lysine N-methyltransferase n=1 Tax=Polarella glacialis TaxID=89957 RepID=A0A813D7E7_POLGL|nr:unnamed protein product [Polarella glacialis]
MSSELLRRVSVDHLRSSLFLFCFVVFLCTELPDRFDVGSYPSPSAYAITKYLVEHRAALLGPSCPDGTLERQPRMLEIGGGTGAVGLVCAALGADVLITERDALLGQINTNIELNRERFSSAGGLARALPLDWKSDAHLQDLRPLADPPFDLLIGSDLIYPATSAIYSRLLHVTLLVGTNQVIQITNDSKQPNNKQSATNRDFEQTNKQTMICCL